MQELNTTFYKCSRCGNIIGLISGDINRIMCCGKRMDLLEANTEDASLEKHMPVYEKTGNQIVVKIGEIAHPMEEDHYIQWIALVSERQTTRIRLLPEEPSEVKFDYIPNSVIYAYCNKHGLWKKEVV